MRDIGKNIRTARTRADLTQDALAELLHVTRQTVSNYETGHSRPDVEMLVTIAEVLKVDVKELLYGPVVPPDRRRERRLLLVGCGLVVLLGVTAAVVLQPPSPIHIYNFQTAVRILVIPLLYALLAWTALQACGLFLKASPLRRPWAAWGRRALLVLLLAYLVLMVPLAVHLIRSGLELLALRQQGDPYSYSSSYDIHPLWNQATMFVVRYITTRPVLFLPLGGLLWAFGFPSKKGTPE